MALSMDEQRVLAQIERHLASTDPALAARLSSLGGPQRAARLRRARVAGSAAALVAVAIVSIVVYALIPLRAVADRPARQPSRQPSRAMMTASHTASPVSPRAVSPPSGPARAHGG